VGYPLGGQWLGGNWYGRKKLNYLNKGLAKLWLGITANTMSAVLNKQGTLIDEILKKLELLSQKDLNLHPKLTPLKKFSS
jgi:hypothetical protein